MQKLKFELLSKDKNARTGLIKTKHGRIKTPVFIPVGTQATVKSLTPLDLKQIGAQIVLANTYHLFLRPGHDLIKNIGGLHKFMAWNRPIMTDSGGFQAFSLGLGTEHGVGKISTTKTKTSKSMCRINEQGINFKSHIDNRLHLFTPEKSIEIQEKLGADIIVALDECTSPLSDYKYTKLAMERTHRWAQRCLYEHKTKQALLGVTQGGKYKNLRIKSTRFIASLPFDGIAIGGAFGDKKKDMHKILKWSIPLLEKNKMRHLLGIGGIDDLFNCVELGIDSFDCVSPTRLARIGLLFVSPKNKKNKWRIRILNSCFKEDKKPIDKNCGCYVCRNFSRAYLRHLFIANELLAYRLASYHNLYLILNLMKEIRKAIEEKNFKKLKKRWLA